MYNREKVLELIGELRAKEKTFKQIADEINLLYGLSYDESTYRKHYNKHKKDFAKIVDKSLAKRMRRVDLEQKKLSIKRGSYNEEIRDKALEELYREAIVEAIEKLPKFNIRTDIKVAKSSKHTYIIVLSDMHYDGNFSVEEVLSYIASQIVQYAKEHPDMEELIIIELGDSIEGAALRPSQMRTIKLGMTDQAIHVEEAYATMLHKLQEETALPIQFHMVTESNHSQIRPANTKRNELPDEDLLALMARYIKARCMHNPNIKINYKDDLFIDFESFNLIASHGHKYKMTPNTYINVAKELRRYFRKKLKNDRKPTHCLFGHFHQYREALLDEFAESRDKAFLVPAISPMISSYERLGLMGTNPGFTIFKFDEDGKHLYTQTINTLTFE